MAKVGVVIAAYNNKDMLRSLILDLHAQTRSPDEIIVIDNASVDGTSSMVTGEFPAVRYVRLEENFGSAGGFREGMKMASESNDLMWVLDDDVSVNPKALAILIDRFEALSKDKDSKVGAVRNWGASFPALSGPRRSIGFAWKGTLFNCLMVREIGLPRAEYFLYADDTEYSLRMAKYGYPLYWIPDIECRVHENRITNKITFLMLGIRTMLYIEAFRLYYAHRNEISVSLEYRNFKMLAATLCHGIKTIILLALIKRSAGLRHMRAVIDGISDGFAGRLGKNPRYLP